MIKNIILDVGMVLVDFCWQDALKKIGFSGEVFEAVANATVRSPLWNEFDRSVQPDEALLAGFQAAAPGYEAQVQMLWEHISDMIVQYPYAKNWIRSLKDAGLHVYILSNYSRRTFQLTQNTGLDFLPLTDGAVFSFQTGYIKPEKEIYHFIMEQYGLQPDECAFIDDNAPNLVYPKKVGWSVVQFGTFEQVQQELDALLHK